MADAFGHGGTFSETPPFSWVSSVKWNTGNYGVLEFIIGRRMLSSEADIANSLGYTGAMGGIETLMTTMISYEPNPQPWPWGPGLKYPADEPDPPDGWINSANEPRLPGVSGLGAGTECQEYGTLGGVGQLLNSVLGRNQTPGLRARTSGSGSFSWPDPPDPPVLFSETAEWGGTTVTLEFYQIDFDNEFEGGSTLFSLDVDFSSCQALNGTNLFHACAAAVVPKEEGLVYHNPPFTGEAVGLNSVRSVTIWVAIQRTV